MRFASFEQDGSAHLGVVTEAGVLLEVAKFDLGEALARWGADEVMSKGRETLKRAAAGTGATSTGGQSNASGGLDLASAKLLPPVGRPPKNIVCVGRNYLDHAQEAARFGVGPTAPPEVPMYFSKPATSLAGHDQEIVFDPAVSHETDYEGELAVVIGRGGSYIQHEDALDHVFGYTVVNDVTSRDLQRLYRQYYKGKGLDNFCPMGPVVVTADEIGDPAKLRLQTHVNGDLRQDASVSMLIFDVATIIGDWTRAMTISPGDLLCTGTPLGVGAGQDPPAFIRDGDVIEVTIDGIGTLRNTFRSRS